VCIGSIYSLRAKVLIPLLVGGTAVAAVGSWFTYRTTIAHLEDQLLHRGQLLASALNHSAMVAVGSDRLQHVVQEVTSDEPEVETIIVATLDPPAILATSLPGLQGHGLDAILQAHFREDLEAAMRTGAFGRHPHPDQKEFILILPLEPMRMGREHDGDHGAGAHMGMGQDAHAGHGGHGMQPGGKPASSWIETSQYRGAILMQLNHRGITAAATGILWRLNATILAAVGLTMLLAYQLLNWRILAPIGALRQAMSRRRSGDLNARAWAISKDEIGEVAATYNEMLDAFAASEERFKAVVHHSPTKIHIKDAEGRYMLVNRQAEKLFGVTEEQVRGKTTRDIFPPEMAASFRSHDKAVLEHRRAFEEEEQFVQEDGVHTFLTVKFPIFNAEGEVAAVGAIGTDITERKQNEAALVKANEQLKEEVQVRKEIQEMLVRVRRQNELILNSAGEGIYGLDLEGRITFINAAGAKMTGWESEDLAGISPKGFPHDQAFDGSPGSPTRPSDAAPVADGAVHQADEAIAWRKDGTCFPVEYTSTPLRNEDGELVGSVVVFRDITDRKRAEEVRLAAKEQAEYANRAKSEFLANMSHELRTPLNAIIGFSDIMHREMFGALGNPGYKEYARDIHDSGEHLLSLINDILDLSKVEAGKFDLHDEDLDVATMVRNAIRLVKGRAAAAQVDLDLEMAEDVPLLRGDQRAIKQILLNLLSNAVKFTEPGGRVTVREEVMSDGRFLLAVSDTGIGISAEDIPVALSPFGQVESSLTRKHQGTGLGLPLVKSLTEAHGGTIEIESAPNIGTTVKVFMPAGRVLGAALEPAAQPQAAG